MKTRIIGALLMVFMTVGAVSANANPWHHHHHYRHHHYGHMHHY